MSSKQPHIFAELDNLMTKLEDAFQQQDWEQVESLLTERNRLAEMTLTADLPTEYHGDARLILEKMQLQDAAMQDQAVQLQSEAREVLQQRQKVAQSIKAYKSID